MKLSTETWSRKQFLVFWCCLVGLIILPRFLLQSSLPTYLFSDDSHSYLLSAFHWTQTGEWETSPRRGAVYSLLIGGILAVFRDLRMLTWVQHLLGATAVLIAAGVLKSQVSSKFLFIALLVSGSFALAGYPIFYEQTVRSEVLLFLFATVALGSWGSYCAQKKILFLWMAGLAFGVATLIKNLLLPFPFLILLGLALDFNINALARCKRVLILLISIALPFLANTGFNLLAGHSPESAPQFGILLYGRVAQWTALDAKTVLPEIKELIRKDIEDYRKLPRLNNNIILKRTAVPRIADWLKVRGGTREELNQICQTLALEAIRTHPREWVQQVSRDFFWLHGRMDFPFQTPDAEDLKDAYLSTTKMKQNDPVLHQVETLGLLADPAMISKMKPYHSVVLGGWLFAWKPVLLTSLLLPLLLVFDPVKSRKIFWLTTSVVWFFNVLIICTVGRPIPRYLAAVLPIMFWAIGGAILLLAAWLHHHVLIRLSRHTRDLV